MIKNCKVCARPLDDEPLLEYKNMPAQAQYLPNVDSLANDTGIDLKIYQCTGCGLVQLSNEPVPYYKEVIRSTSFSKEMTAFRKKQFKSFIKDHDLVKKKIIEIGCGSGHYLSLMDKLDVNARGIESSSESVEICKQFGLNVEQAFIEKTSQKLDGAPFDAFFIMSFLEHLSHPNKLLGGIYNNLKDGAVGLVEVPNFNMNLKNNLFSEFISDHLFYFTEETLRRVLGINGFDVLDCQPVWYDYILSAVVKKRVGLDLSNFQSFIEKLKKEIENYLKLFPEKSVAIWGAGHQSITMISLLGLGNKIRYVVDSAIFKQGKFTPATHIPIVEPNRLNLDPPEAIIVIAASYSDEVIKIIRSEYSPTIKVSTLINNRIELV